MVSQGERIDRQRVILIVTDREVLVNHRIYLKEACAVHRDLSMYAHQTGIDLYSFPSICYNFDFNNIIKISYSPTFISENMQNPMYLSVA